MFKVATHSSIEGEESRARLGARDSSILDRLTDSVNVGMPSADMDARSIASKAMRIAADADVMTNHSFSSLIIREHKIEEGGI